MRRVAGWGLLLVAALCLLTGAGLAVLLGPDDRVTSDPQPLDTTASVVVTAPGLISWSGPSVRIDVTLPADRPVFVGLGNTVDVSDYTGGVAARVVDGVGVPFHLDGAEATGVPALPAKPSSLDWWLAEDQGRGGAGLSAQLPSSSAQLLVAAADGGDLRGLTVRAALDLDGGFGLGLGLAGLAVGLALFARIALRSPGGGAGGGEGGGAGGGEGGRDGDGDDRRANDAEPVEAKRADHARRTRVHGGARRLVTLTCVLALVGGTAACAVPRPVADQPEKAAVTRSEADAVLDRWADSRAAALRGLDAGLLTGVEAGDTLAVDRGALTVARRLLEQAPRGPMIELDVRSVVAPRLSAYPLWFLAVVDDADRGLTRVQVHERRSAIAAWQLVETAEVLPTTRLPDLALEGTGALEPVAADDATGLDASPQTMADAYAELLDDPAARDSPVLVDSFVQQMRSVAQAQALIDNVRFDQSWSSDDVRWAARTRDGGALVFATMRRRDHYRIEPDTAVDWAEGSEQTAFLAGRGYTSAVLRYRHQVLMYVPPQGSGQVRALGQYGGVVSAAGT